MTDQKYNSLEDYYSNIVQRAVEECIACGECVKDCMTYSLTSLKDRAPEDIMQKVLDLFKDGILSDDAYIKAFSCSGCGYCSGSCPQGLDPLLLHEALKIELVRRGKEPPEAMAFVLPGQRFNLYEILAGLQTKPSEVRWSKAPPTRPEKRENVLFLGCCLPALPATVFPFLDVLERMGIDFVTVAGGDLCCGTVFCPAGGKVRESEEKARQLVAALAGFSPQRVILMCTGCYRQFTEFYPRFLDLPFEVRFFAEFLNDNLERLCFTRPLEKTVTIHDACMPTRTKAIESARELLKAIPDLQVVEREHVEEDHLCCGGLANMTYPQVGQQLGQVLVKDITKTAADYIINICPFCQLGFYPHIKEHSFGLRNITDLLNESVGGRQYTNMLEKYWRCKTTEEVIAMARDTFQANGYTEEEMRGIIPLIFNVL